jgi:hypothetical protein
MLVSSPDEDARKEACAPRSREYVDIAEVFGEKILIVQGIGLALAPSARHIRSCRPAPPFKLEARDF